MCFLYSSTKPSDVKLNCSNFEKESSYTLVRPLNTPFVNIYHEHINSLAFGSHMKPFAKGLI
jgi:hypothetical protein